MIADGGVGSWGVLVIIVVVVPLMLLWAFTVVDLLRRRDLPGAKKLAWIAFVILVPIIGVLAYFLARPVRPTEV